jgi:hypothetical protein
VVSQNFRDKKPEITRTRTKHVLILKKPTHLSQKFCPEIWGGSNYEIIRFEPEKRGYPNLLFGVHSRSPSSLGGGVRVSPKGGALASAQKLSPIILMEKWHFLDFSEIFSEENQRPERMPI